MYPEFSKNPIHSAFLKAQEDKSKESALAFKEILAQNLKIIPIEFIKQYVAYAFSQVFDETSGNARVYDDILDIIIAAKNISDAHKNSVMLIFKEKLIDTYQDKSSEKYAKLLISYLLYLPPNVHISVAFFMQLVKQYPNHVILQTTALKKIANFEFEHLLDCDSACIDCLSIFKKIPDIDKPRNLVKTFEKLRNTSNLRSFLEYIANNEYLLKYLANNSCKELAQVLLKTAPQAHAINASTLGTLAHNFIMEFTFFSKDPDSVSIATQIRLFCQNKQNLSITEKIEFYHLIKNYMQKNTGHDLHAKLLPWYGLLKEDIESLAHLQVHLEVSNLKVLK